MSEQRGAPLPGRASYPARNPFPPRGTTSMEERVLDSALIDWEMDAPTAELPSVERLWSIAQRYLSDVATGRRAQGQVAFLHGDHGSGKTHAVRHVLGRLGTGPGRTGQAPYRLYVKAQDDDFVACYRRLMSQLDPPVLRDLSLRFMGAIAGVEAGRAYGAEAEAAATSMLRAEPDRLNAMLQELMVEPGAVLQAQARELTEIAGDQEDFQRGLTSLLDPMLEEAAYDWLAGREIDPKDASRLGVAGPITDPELCRYGIQLVVAMCARAGRPVVVVFDQCERLVLDQGDGAGRRNEGLLHSLVERIPQENGMLVLAGNEQAWKSMHRDLKQRFGHNVISSSVVTLDQAVRLLGAYLRESPERADGLHPFRLSGVRALLTLSGGNVRRFLQLCWLVFERAAPDRAPITRSTVERAVEGNAPLLDTREADPATLSATLAEALADLDGDGRVAVIELTAEGMIIYDLQRDEADVPHGRRRPLVPWPDLIGDRGRDRAPDTSVAEALVRAAEFPFTTDVVIVCSSPGDPLTDQATTWLHAVYPEAPCFTTPGVLVDELLRQAIRAEPLRRSYDLVVLRTDPVSGRLELGGLPLFAIGARRGETAEVAVHCPPAGERGTVFAIVAWRGNEPRLVSVSSAKLVPGPYAFTAELERAGRVRLTGLADLRPEERSWAELVAAVPPGLDSPWESAHLICAVEVSGTPEGVDARLARIHEVIACFSESLLGRLEVSLVAYGAHTYERHHEDPPVEVLTWRATAEGALDALATLARRDPLPEGYPLAAQLEDMLATVADRLDAGDHGRTVLLTVGDRPPHPPRVHRSEILPCPRRHDWESLLNRLERHPGMALVAICDQPPEWADAVWSRLAGRHVPSHLDAVDVLLLAADAGLPLAPVQRIPFPLAGLPPHSSAEPVIEVRRAIHP